MNILLPEVPVQQYFHDFRTFHDIFYEKRLFKVTDVSVSFSIKLPMDIVITGRRIGLVLDAEKQAEAVSP